MAEEDIFGGEDLFDSGDFADFEDLGETPDFSDLGDSGLGISTDADRALEQAFAEDEPGISRTFKIAVGAIGVTVVGIIGLLIVYAVTNDPGLSSGAKTSTSAVETNEAVIVAYEQTRTALDEMATATQYAIATSVAEVTATHIGQMTLEAQMTLDAAATKTAQANASATASAIAVTQEAIAAIARETEAAANRLAGQVVVEGNVPLSNLTIRLWRDDGDRRFGSTGETPPVPGEAPIAEPTTEAGAETGGEAGSAPTATLPIEYGQMVPGTLARGETALWTFFGNESDVVLINAIANDAIQMDMFLRLIGPDGVEYAYDDDSGEASNAMIKNFTLPLTGEYTIQVSSVAAGGDYTLSLSSGLTTPGTEAETGTEGEGAPTPEAAPPTQESSSHNISEKETGLVLARVQAPASAPLIPAQEGTPTPVEGDQLIETVITGENGEFDFGTLEPGIYWLELEYDSLPPDLQALVPPGATSTFMITVPVTGEVIIEVFEIPPTPTPAGTLGPIEQTAAARQTREAVSTPLPTGMIETLPATEEATGTVVTLPEGGAFDGIGDGGELDGAGGLTVLAIAAAGLVAVVFIARKLRASG